VRKYFYKGNIKINRYGEQYNNFDELNNLILEADLIISADSLPAHIAIMMKKKIIIFNPNKKFYPSEFYLKNMINQALIFELNKNE
jgi:ADP-heptose:LPS heptosyltransferase